MGSGMILFERALVSSYRTSIVTSPLSWRVSEILLLLCSSTPLFPTPPLVSPNFFHVPLGVGGWATKHEGVGLIIRQLVSKICNLCGPDPPTLQTDRQTDRRTDGRTDDVVQSQYGTALCTYASRFKNQHFWKHMEGRSLPLHTGQKIRWSVMGLYNVRVSQVKSSIEFIW